MATVRSSAIIVVLGILSVSCFAMSHHIDEVPAAGDADFASRSTLFATDLFTKISESNPGKNIIYSPFSIQTCVALAHAGAAGKTAEEIVKGIHLVSDDRYIVAGTFKKVLDAYSNSSLLKIANKFYLKNGYEVQDNFNEIATKSFHSEAENLNFGDNVKSAFIMNDWVEKQTNGKIKNLISSSSLDSDTRMVLINAVHFKGQWENKFKETSTRQEDFWLNDDDTVKVSMMNTKAKFFYVDLPDLDATAIMLPYKDSHLSMLILLPNTKTGLKALEGRLGEIDLLAIKTKMRKNEVIVKLPKFKVEFEIQLADQLKKLGMTSMFDSSADFSNLLKSPEQLYVSKVVHKAFIEVNEEGTEAAAATGYSRQAVGRMVLFEPEPNLFTCDRPFLYFIGSFIAANVFEYQNNRQDFIAFTGNFHGVE